ncbi:MAG: M24 family metallopeptidase [Acidobacteria bacterium]|nr:M24 family metallopeptidase [Acidobacteriota bacterium]MCL5287702.1 M24 family metallopeptidase [Acidobacteriota bacterium]
MKDNKMTEHISVFTTLSFLLVFSLCAVTARGQKSPAPAPTLAERKAEVAEKVSRVRTFLEREKLSGVLLGHVRNFAWLTGGGDIHIVLGSPSGAASLLVLADGRKFLISPNNESLRLMNEELAGLGFELREYKWYEDKLATDRKMQIVRELAGGALASDLPYGDLRVVEKEIAALRVPLMESEIVRLRWLGRETTEAVAEVARKISPGMSEREMEAMTADALMRRGIRPTVLLMGADERIRQYRHATPNDARIQRYAMINVCSERWGLTIAVTRFVHFGPLPRELAERAAAVARVDATFLAHTVADATADAILQAAARAYEKEGYAGEWEKHHQGGAIGYMERDWVTFPGLVETVHVNQAFAWNPTIAGTKSEDTVLVTGKSLEVLTVAKNWPTIEVEVEGKKWKRPAILVRALPKKR